MDAHAQNDPRIAADEVDSSFESSGQDPAEDDAADTDLPVFGANDADLSMESAGEDPAEDDAADTDLPLTGA